MATDFGTAESDNKAFFGTGQKATMQWLTRLVDAFTERIDEMPDSDEQKAEHIAHKKIPMAVRAMCKLALKSGVESEDLLRCASERMHFLTLAPTSIRCSSAWAPGD